MTLTVVVLQTKVCALLCHLPVKTLLNDIINTQNRHVKMIRCQSENAEGKAPKIPKLLNQLKI